MKKKKLLSLLVIALALVVIFLCVASIIIVTSVLSNLSEQNNTPINTEAIDYTVPRESTWGIYSLDLETKETSLIFSSENKISSLAYNANNERFIFSQKVNGDTDQDEEILTLGKDGSDLQRITQNDYWDLYPVWSSDGEQIAFLRFNTTLDIYTMNSDGSNQKLLYDSSFHDADINWQGDNIVFTRNSQIWIMNEDGSNPRAITNPHKAGQENNANLPFGDYDPRLSPDGEKIVFERLVNDDSPHGNYDIFSINVDGSNERQLTNTSYTQGFAVWSPTGEKVMFLVTAIGTSGEYEMYMINKDGSNNENITPDYFPADFLCHSPIFSDNENLIYFVGQWWE